MSENSEEGLNPGENRLYFTQFFARYYRDSGSWEDEQRRFEHVRDTLETLLESYLDAGVFGAAELTVLKFVTQVESTVGVDKTKARIRETAGTPESHQRAVELLDADIEKGIVGGACISHSIS